MALMRMSSSNGLEHVIRHSHKKQLSLLRAINFSHQVIFPDTNLNDITVEVENDSSIIPTTALSGNTSWDNSTVFDEMEWRKNIYLIVIPIMLTICFITIVLNLVIFVSMKWVRRSISATLCFNVSLALADAYASLIIGVGLVINSLLPFVFSKYQFRHDFEQPTMIHLCY